jgi:Eco57I restriction-modification methylase
MKTDNIKRYAPQARTDFIAAVTKQAAKYGITDGEVLPVEIKGDVALIGDRPFPSSIVKSRDALVQKVELVGFSQAMEQAAYSWFNRLCALRYMELAYYLGHGRRVLSHPEQDNGYQILEDCLDIDLPGLDKAQVRELKLDGTKDEELYRELLLAQCHALHEAMPFLFEPVEDATELLLPENLTKTDSLIKELVTAIPEEDWANIEIIGWLYQFYISEKKDEVIGKVVKSEDIPAATQLFTPNWIVKYMVQNSLGAQWLATYPDSPLKAQMQYYIEPAEQTDEVNAQLAAITPSQLNPEELTLIDPASGSGHILVEAYELFKAIYLERGFRQRDVPQLILEKNLFGLDIDERAAQLTGFALMMKGRGDDRRLFERGVKLNVMALVDSAGFDAEGLAKGAALSDYGLKPGVLTELARLFEHATTFGSLIQVPEELAKKLPALRLLSEVSSQDLFVSEALKRLGPLVQQAELLAAQYDAVVANPPYMGSKYIEPTLKRFLSLEYPTAGADIYPAFIERALTMIGSSGCVSMITLQNWLYISGMHDLRHRLLNSTSLRSVVQVGFNSFPSMNSKFAVAAISVVFPRHFEGWKTRFLNLNETPPSSDKNAVFLNYASDNRFDDVLQREFVNVPDSIVAYTLTPELRALVSEGPSLGRLAPPMRGLATGDNPQFIRSWPELAICDIELERQSVEKSRDSSKKWFPYNMGGQLRKWYGNLNFVVNWQDGGKEIRNLRTDTGRLRSRPQNIDAYFHQGITWKEIGIDFCGRYFPFGMISDQTSDFLVVDGTECFSLLAFLNSSTASHLIGALNPTLHFNVGTLRALPINPGLSSEDLRADARTAVSLAKEEWDEQEISWDFDRNRLLFGHPFGVGSIETNVTKAVNRSLERLGELTQIGTILNSKVGDLYRVPKEVRDESGDGGLGIEALNEQQTLQELVSYAIGCMMGRYSLDAPGLIYAHSGNEGFDPSRYPTFPADDDGIVPLTDTDWFDDDAAHRVEEFISVAWDTAHLDDNLAFLADNLAPKRGESSRDTIRRYLCDKFYKDHMQTYKKRPIYWLFSSGKQKAFQCLVYLHRYNEGTLARMRTEYVIPLTSKLSSHVEKLEQDKDASGATAEIKRLQKQIDTLHKQQAELSAFDEKLRHYADHRISLDLDDGVKVNYGKFGDLLADVKSITGKNPV